MDPIREPTNPSASTLQPPVKTYLDRLHEDDAWSWHEAGAYFKDDSEVFRTLRRLAASLDAMNIPYAVIGALAMKAHKYERFTTDVDLIVSRESLRKIHDALEGRGYLAPFEGSNNRRDTTNGVKIDLLIAGGYPGDGKEKPIDFPDPASGTVEIDGLRYVTIEKLVELKLASGMTRELRLCDLGDVQKMIHALKLPRSFGDRLHPYVRAKFDEFWLACDADELKDEF
jgi:hypothetical protein